MKLDRPGCPKEGRVEFLEPRVLGQKSLMKEQSDAIPIVERSVGASTDLKPRCTVLPESRISDQNTVVKDPSNCSPVDQGTVSIWQSPRRLGLEQD